MTNLKLRNHILRCLKDFNPVAESSVHAKCRRSPHSQYYTYEIYFQNAKFDDIVSKIMETNPHFERKRNDYIVVSDDQTVHIGHWHADGCIVSVVGLNPRRKFAFTTDYD